MRECVCVYVCVRACLGLRSEIPQHADRRAPLVWERQPAAGDKASSEEEQREEEEPAESSFILAFKLDCSSTRSPGAEKESKQVDSEEGSIQPKLH